MNLKMNGIVGLVLLAIIVVSANLVISTLPLRKDMTAEKLYTLSDGSKAVLGKLESEVTLKFYFSESSPEMPMALKDYARQVSNLLSEYALSSNSHLILEEYEHAVARGAHIYAEMVGGGLSADAHHMTAPHPEGHGAYMVMKNAIEDAELSVNDIDYINVHGTSTPLGDISEVKAIKKLFGDHAYELNISSTKSMTGHLLGAAGAVEAMLTVLAVANDIIPPTINFHEGDEDPEIDYKLNLTFNKAQKRPVRAALSNTFGFGGHNASVIFKKI
jgi:hypothetical protein